MKKILFMKLFEEAQIPQISREGDAGYDIYSIEDRVVSPHERIAVRTGIASAFSSGYVALIWDRGGMAYKYGLKTMAGVIDSNYRGEWMIVLYNTTDQVYKISKGDRIAQAIFQQYQTPAVEVVTDLPESVRNDHKYGSSGK